MPTLGKAYVQIIPSADGISGSISNLLGGEVESAGQTAGESLGSKLMSVAKKAIAAAGIGKFIAESLNQGGELQQSIGGVETLFKESADQVKAYAAQAFETTGLSANEYMQNVTGFSASLLQSLGGDTAKAAEIANTAMVDMADNSNKMGTSMEAIQNAYSGFAKQNYTMLDNLKLGYGGTKTEMQRLLKDAQKLTGVKYDINSLSDVYEAIHAVQGELGITGTTAKEASETLQGSFSAMKASFTDLLGTMSTGGDIGPQIKALAKTASTYLFKNLIPMVGQILANVPSMITGVIEEGIPMLVTEGGKLIKSLGEGIANDLPSMAEAAMQTITGYVTGLSSNMGSVITGGMSLITNLMTGIMQTVPVLLTYIPQILSGVVTTIVENLPMIVQSGMDLISNLASGVWENRLIIWDYISGITGEMFRLVTEIDWAGLGRSVIEWIAGGVQFLFNNLPNLLQEIGTSAWNLLSSIDWLGLGGVVIETIVSGIDALFDAIPDILTSIGEAGKKLFTEIDWLSVGSDIINGIVEGVKGAGEMLWGAIKDVASSALESVKKFLHIGSPSRLFADQVGRWIPEGIAVGVEGNLDPLTKAMEDMAMDAAAVPVEQIITDGRRLSGLQGNTTTNNLGGVNITFNVPEGATSREIAEEAVDIIINELRRSYA